MVHSEYLVARIFLSASKLDPLDSDEATITSSKLPKSSIVASHDDDDDVKNE
jgi:hypothetical protein